MPNQKLEKVNLLTIDINFQLQSIKIIQEQETYLCHLQSTSAKNLGASSYQYRNSHHKDKMVSRPFYPCNGNFRTGKDHLYIETGPRHLFH